MKTEASLLQAIAAKYPLARPVPTKEGSGGDGAEKFQYFYHPDHLGSTSYITDASGEVYQHLEYFAFGGTFVEEHSNTNRTPFLFNGKELDEETGLYYYGARYYDEQTSIWLSVDPLAEKYPTISPYAYVANNPLNYTDPDGKKIKGVKIKNGVIEYSKRAIKNGTRRYVQARMKTKSGSAAVMSMIAADKTYSVMVTDEVFVLPSGKGGKYALAGGVTDAEAGILVISTNNTKFSELTDDQLKSAVTLDDYGDLTGVNISRTDLEQPLSDPQGDYQQGYKDAYNDSGMAAFESNSNNKYGSVEELIHGVGAHEETHLVDSENIKDQNIKNEYDRAYQTEKPAFENEKKARQEYKNIN